MGDDDEMMPNYLSEFNNLIIKFPHLDVYHCRSFIIDDDSEIKSLTPSWPEFESVYENIWHRMKGLRSQYISDFVYRRESLVSRGGFYKLPVAWASDDISFFEASASKGSAHLQHPVFCYRESDITLSNSGSVDLKMKAIDGEEKWYENFLKYNKPNNKIDSCFYENIWQEKNKYFLSKRIETIAYNGIRKNHLLSDFITFFKKRKIYHLNLQHMIYAVMLFIKKNKAKNS